MPATSVEGLEMKGPSQRDLSKRGPGYSRSAKDSKSGSRPSTTVSEISGDEPSAINLQMRQTGELSIASF